MFARAVDGLGSAGDAELGVHMLEVFSDCQRRDPERACDFTVGVTLRDKRKNLSFAAGESKRSPLGEHSRSYGVYEKRFDIQDC